MFSEESDKKIVDTVLEARYNDHLHELRRECRTAERDLGQVAHISGKLEECREIAALLNRVLKENREED